MADGKDKNVSFRIDTELWEKFVGYCHDNGCGKTSVEIRRLIERECRGGNPSFDVETKNKVDSLVYALTKLGTYTNNISRYIAKSGVNVNQIARAINSGMGLSDQDISDVAREVDLCSKKVDEVVAEISRVLSEMPVIK